MRYIAEVDGFVDFRIHGTPIQIRHLSKPHPNPSPPLINSNPGHPTCLTMHHFHHPSRKRHLRLRMKHYTVGWRWISQWSHSDTGAKKKMCMYEHRSRGQWTIHVCLWFYSTDDAATTSIYSWLERSMQLPRRMSIHSSPNPP